MNNTNEHEMCPLSREEFCVAIEKKVERIAQEFHKGFLFVGQFPKSVSFFGSSRFTPDNHYCKHAERLAGHIAKELGYAVITGGSQGIMEAANKGAFEAGGKSVGLNIKLPRKQFENKYTTDSIEFSYFFARKVALSYAAEAYIFFPGGFGTLDEFFEILTLVQTHKIRRVPIFLVGADYWAPLQSFVTKTICEINNAVEKSDLSLYTITDDDSAIVEAIRVVPVSDGLSKVRRQ